MKTFWTPDGERPVGQSQTQTPPQSTPRKPAGFEEPTSTTSGNETSRRQMEEFQRQLGETPADVVVANHCFGLFELAALHLSLDPPKLAEAQLAIDALGALVESLSGRLGEAEPQLRDGLANLRLAFVQIRQRSDG